MYKSGWSKTNDLKLNQREFENDLKTHNCLFKEKQAIKNRAIARF
jgi:hypothetical protein